MKKQHILTLFSGIFLALGLSSLVSAQVVPSNYVEQSNFNFALSTISPAFPESIDGNRIAIGDYNYQYLGAVRVYSYDGTNWNLEAFLKGGDILSANIPVRFGYNVILKGDHLGIASPGHAIFMYHRVNNQWILVSTITPPAFQDTNFDGALGWGNTGSMALTTNNTLIVEGRGIVYQYNFSGNTWKLGSFPAVTAATYATDFGNGTVKLAADNTSLVVAGQNPQRNQANIFVFSQSGLSWVPEAQLPLNIATYLLNAQSFPSNFILKVAGSTIIFKFPTSTYDAVGVFSRAKGTGQWLSKKVLPLSPMYLAANIDIQDDNMVAIGAYRSPLVLGPATGLPTSFIMQRDDNGNWYTAQQINNFLSTGFNQNKLTLVSPGNFLNMQVYAPVSPTVTVSLNLSSLMGTGTITSNPGGINCSVAALSLGQTGTCFASFPSYKPVTLTAKLTQSTISSWGVSGCTAGTTTCTFTPTTDIYDSIGIVKSK